MLARRSNLFQPGFRSISVGLVQMDNSAQTSDPATAYTASSTAEQIAASAIGEVHAGPFSDSITTPPELLRVLRPPPRSLARRITERLLLGVAALLLYAGLTWIPFEASRPAAILRGSIESSQGTPAAESPVDFAAQPSKAEVPSWLSPNLLYVPAWSPPSPASPNAEVRLPLPRPTRE